MKIPQIQIQTIPAKLEMQNAIPRGKLQIDQKKGQINIESIPPKIKMDTTESRAALNLKNNEQFAKDATTRSQQEVMAFIEKKNSDGIILSQIENKQDAFAVIAQQQSVENPVEIRIQSIPRPNISLQRGDVKLSIPHYPEQAVRIKYQETRLEINYIPGKVTIDQKI